MTWPGEGKACNGSGPREMSPAGRGSRGQNTTTEGDSHFPSGRAPILKRDTVTRQAGLRNGQRWLETSGP